MIFKIAVRTNKIIILLRQLNILTLFLINNENPFE